jgi:YfiH family protein
LRARAGWGSIEPVTSSPSIGRGAFRAVEEVPHRTLPAVVQPEWKERFPWLVQGTTHAAGDFDLGLFSDASSPRDVLTRWDRLRAETGMSMVACAHQIHGGAVRWHGQALPGFHLSNPCDGHATATAGTLLGVTIADCVPVSVVDPRRRAVALLHAGWRGAAAGVLERGLALLAERGSSGPAELHVHLGPAICGTCYEVGPEVFEALGLTPPRRPTPIDLRAVVAGRVLDAGVPAEHITVSTHCTRCSDGFFSHRGGDRGRQAGFLGIKAT